jgi:RHS repeat-associated protein
MKRGFTKVANPTTPTSEGFGLMYYRARWYDPYLNHFTQPDTIIPDLGNPQSWDRYAYTLNNPIRYNDPSGHMQACADGDEGGGCGRGANTEEIFKKFDKQHGGHDGAAEYYAKLHTVTIAKARKDPNLLDYIDSAEAAKQNYLTWMPQKEFDPSALVSPGEIYGVAKAITDIGSDFISGGAAAVFTLFPAPQGARGNFLSPFGFPDLGQSPGEGFNWRGSSPNPGSPEGSWYNSETKEYLRFDPNHHGTQHLDYRGPDGNEYWIWPDGSMTIKP